MTQMSFSDLGQVNWGATGKLALARGAGAAIIWGVLGLATHFVGLKAFPIVLLQWTLAASIGAPLYHLLVRGIRAVFGGIPMVQMACNILLLMISLVIAAGDPLVFLVNRQFPGLLGVESFRAINLEPAIFVLR